MKWMLKFCSHIIHFTLMFTVSLLAGACRQPVHIQAATDENVQHLEKEKQNRKEEQKFDNNDAGCLDPNVPQPKRTVFFGVLNGRAIDIPKPKYPAEAKAANLTSEVKAVVVIGETGEVIWAQIQTGHPLLQSAVKKVVCQARFNPITVSGRAIKVGGVIIYNFVLP